MLDTNEVRIKGELAQLHLNQPDFANARKKFTEMARIDEIFLPFEKVKSDHKSLLQAGIPWLFFSQKIPEVLRLVADYSTDEEFSKNIAHICEDELGFGNPKANHAKLFKDCLIVQGLSDEAIVKSLETNKNRKVLNLIEDVKTKNNEWFNLGLILGLEIVAYENINTVLSLISLEDKLRLFNMPYFKIHFVAEDEHINLNIQNYLGLSSSKEKRLLYLEGFNSGIEFWVDFWKPIQRNLL